MKHPKKFNSVLFQPSFSPLKPLEYLLKYAPKVHRTLPCQISDLKNHKVTHKIKKLKILKAFNIKDYNQESKDLVLKTFLPLKNYIKEISVTNPTIQRHFPRLSTFVLNVKSLSSWKTFSMLLHIRSLTTEFVNDLTKCKAPKAMHPRAVSNLNHFFWRHLSKLNCLRHLSLHLYNQFNQQLFKFFSRLNSLDSLLTSLKTLTLFFNHIEITYPYNFFFPNIYKSLTILKAHESSLNSIQKLLVNPELFQSLEFISIIKTVRDFEEDFLEDTIRGTEIAQASGNNLAYFDFFEGLGVLKKVKEIDIAINLSTESAFLSFLSKFTLPKSVRAIKLNLYETCWGALTPRGGDIEQVFAEAGDNKILERFYSQWTGLDRLENLSLCFSEQEINKSPSLYFITPMMKRLSTLKELYYANWSNNIWENKKKTIDFDYLWQSLKHLKPSLRTLYLENPAISLRNFAEIPANEGGYNLEKLGFCGVVVGDKQISHLKGLFNKGLREASIKGDIEIERLMVENQETLEQLLGDLVQIHKMVDFSINIDVRNIKAETLVDMICGSVPRFQKDNLIRLSFCNISMDVAKPSLVEKLKATFNRGNKEEKGIRLYSEEGGILFTNRKRSQMGKMQKHATFGPPGIPQMAHEDYDVYSMDQSLDDEIDSNENDDDDDFFESDDDELGSDDENDEEIIEDF